MQTSAHTGPLAEYTGTLLHNAQARHTILDAEGHTTPVLCMELELDNALRTHLHVEQPFTGHHLESAAMAAQRLKKGMRVTVQAPLITIRIVAPQVTHITVNHTHRAAQTAP